MVRSRRALLVRCASGRANGPGDRSASAHQRPCSSCLGCLVGRGYGVAVASECLVECRSCRGLGGVAAEVVEPSAAVGIGLGSLDADTSAHTEASIGPRPCYGPSYICAQWWCCWSWLPFPRRCLGRQRPVATAWFTTPMVPCGELTSASALTRAGSSSRASMSGDRLLSAALVSVCSGPTSSDGTERKEGEKGVSPASARPGPPCAAV
jgi:hypothetical protein